MRNNCLNFLARIVASMAITTSLVEAGALSAEAKDDKTESSSKVSDDFWHECNAKGGPSRTGYKIWPKITSVEVKQDHPHSLVGGEIIDVTVKGNFPDFPDGAKFVFSAYEDKGFISEDDSDYVFYVVKQDLQDSTLHATLRVPRVGNRTYRDLTVFFFAPPCQVTHERMLFKQPESEQPKTAGSTSQGPRGRAANPHQSARGVESQTATATVTPAPAPALAQTVAPAPTTAQTAVPAASALTSEKPHVIRIGVASPDAQLGQGAARNNVAEPIRTMLIQYLNGPGLEITPITAMLPMQIEAEAKEKGYDYVLYSSVTEKKGSGISMFKAASIASALTPIGAMAGASRAAATAAAGTGAAAQAANVSSMTKAKTEYTLAYKLVAAGNPNPVLSNSATAKAKTDSEDVMTPLVQQAATAIVGQVTAKK